jgi:hypothetical protein
LVHLWWEARGWLPVPLRERVFDRWWGIGRHVLVVGVGFNLFHGLGIATLRPAFQLFLKLPFGFVVHALFYLVRGF